jgi:hypothetical protein
VTNSSSTPILLIFLITAPRSAASSKTPDEKPPAKTCSSAVIIFLEFLIAFKIIFSSNGLINLASTTAVLYPLLFKILAAFSAG